MLVGIGVGFAFYIVYFITLSILGGSLAFSVYELGKMAVLIVTGALAGILGINL